MENEFVPYEFALQLKELGFDKPCFRVYDALGFLQDEKEMDELHLVKISAPLYQQAFRFFREKHDWTIKINQISKDTWSYTLTNYPKNKIYYGKVYIKYEEAELECLRKLIEISKNNLVD